MTLLVCVDKRLCNSKYGNGALPNILNWVSLNLLLYPYSDDSEMQN